MPPGFPGAETFAGTYLDPQTKTIYKFTAEGGNLMGWGEALQRVAANQYYDLHGDTMTFANNNGVMHLTLPFLEKCISPSTGCSRSSSARPS